MTELVQHIYETSVHWDSQSSAW